MHIKDRVANSPVKSSKDTVSDTGRIKERAFQVDLIVERCSVTIGEIRNRPVGVKVFERQVWLLKHAPHGNADIIIQSRPPLFTVYSICQPQLLVEPQVANSSPSVIS